MNPSRPSGQSPKPRKDRTRDDAPPPEIPGLAARLGALEVLERVRGGEAMDAALARSRAFSQLEGADRAFSRAMASAALRRRGAIDHVLGAWIDRPLPRRAVRVMDILRLVAAQSMILGVPDHAAVSTATALAKERQETANYANLVNAVSRKIAKAGPDALARTPERADAPGWMWRGWERQFGPAKARAIAAAHRHEAPLDLTPKDPASLQGLAETLSAEIILDHTLRLAAVSDVTALDGFKDGQWWVQDVAASLPTRLLGPVAGKTVLDLCAAPGGKTLQLAAGGAKVTAVDISSPRLERIKENLSRTALSAELVEADILKWRPAQLADAVLLDAPCTATGTIRRHPDLPWLKTDDDVAALSALQAKMIDHALTCLKPGGTLIYCVCSLQPEEGERQAAAALARNPSITRMAITPEDIGGLKDAINRDGDLRTLPSMLADKGGMDGFFAARFVLAA